MPSETQLSTLLAGCHRREASAQRELYYQWYGFAVSIAAHYGKDEAEAEEIVQDAFLKLFVALAREAFSGDFTKWFRRIIVNAGIDYYRKYAKYRHLQELKDYDGSGDTDNLAVRSLEMDDCLRFLQQLSPGYRLVFNLFVLEGFTHPEIAKKLGISEGTSKSNLAKARKVLRRLAVPFFDHPSNKLLNV